MKFIKNNFKLIIGFIVGVILASSITVYAYNYIAGDISYTKPGTEATISVEEALNELYLNNKKIQNYTVLYENSYTANNNSYSYTTTQSYPIIIALAYVVNDAPPSVSISCSNDKYNNIISAQNLIAGKAQSKTTIGFITDCPSGTEFTFSGWWATSFKVIALY